MKKTIGNPQFINENIAEKIKNTKINLEYIKKKKDFKDQIILEINSDDVVLDIGKTMGEKYDLINSKIKQTLDMNDFGDYPDIVFDLCSEMNSEIYEKYDKIICLAILEHIYNPFKAVENLTKMLKKDGTLFGYVPFLYHYHAHKNLKFQDYFRFSKDALIYLLKDFKNLELYPYRGRYSHAFNIMFPGRWKKYVEKTGINIFLDKFASDDKNIKQCSGYYFIAKK
ncbi:hypothetical protein N9K25_00535 [Candidatus Pelagibacter sp.]|nr:hypothetical protein [Candidatus Pelagibacter sp.]